MIVASFEKNDKALHLKINGHSGYSSDGNDIVCAAISGIFYSLVGYLANSFGERLTINDISSGNADIECDEEGIEALRMACIGMIQISEMYPDFVEVRNGIWKSKRGKI